MYTLKYEKLLGVFYDFSEIIWIRLAAKMIFAQTRLLKMRVGFSRRVDGLLGTRVLLRYFPEKVFFSVKKLCGLCSTNLLFFSGLRVTPSTGGRSASLLSSGSVLFLSRSWVSIFRFRKNIPLRRLAVTWGDCLLEWRSISGLGDLSRWRNSFRNSSSNLLKALIYFTFCE